VETLVFKKKIKNALSENISSHYAKGHEISEANCGVFDLKKNIYIFPNFRLSIEKVVESKQ
jgi:hypothetical protein